MSGARRANVRAFAKLNLDLRVLGPRPDGYHELRTVFQTISLADRIGISFTPAAETCIEVVEGPAIEDNLVVRAARLVLDSLGVTGVVEFRLEKHIPMGGGLGGGSSDAAAVLLALPVLAGGILPIETLLSLAASLGSDVSFFLLGGTALGLGRGEELYPLPDFGPLDGVLVTSSIHSSTRDAYRALDSRLTTELKQNNIVSFQSRVWTGCGKRDGERHPAHGINDFESWVFEQYPQLRRLRESLEQAGARPAMMTGSGSAIFGLFRARDQAERAIATLRKECIDSGGRSSPSNAEISGVIPVSLVSRSRFRAVWRRSLRAHTNGSVWPPQSRYAQ
jgi:4-diphosphocytidyl-2-C-methyl-D-erythritol kinase